MSTLENEFIAALQAGTSNNVLIEIVLRHKSHGISQADTYNALERIWAELSKECKDPEKNPLCEQLGAIMDRVWGYCPSSQRIWNTSLSEADSEERQRGKPGREPEDSQRRR